MLDIDIETGLWAMDFADVISAPSVIGTDLSTTQLTWGPPKCKFVLDDAESDWLSAPDEAFDYILRRGLGGSIADWSKFYRQV